MIRPSGSAEHQKKKKLYFHQENSFLHPKATMYTHTVLNLKKNKIN